MKLKIYDGTPTEVPHLCKTCIHAINMTVANENQSFCHAIPSWSSSTITGKVTKCSGYEADTERRILREFGQAAWYLERAEDGKLEWSTPAERNGPPRTRAYARRANRANRLNPAPPPAPEPPPAAPTQEPAPAAQPLELGVAE